MKELVGLPLKMFLKCFKKVFLQLKNTITTNQIFIKILRFYHDIYIGGTMLANPLKHLEDQRVKLSTSPVPKYT